MRKVKKSKSITTIISVLCKKRPHAEGFTFVYESNIHQNHELLNG